VPHTVEEAYELADAARAGDDERMLDELGDVLFQVYFLSLLLEERGKGDLAAVADHCREKLIRRHPHVFGERAAETAGDVVRNWNQIKRDEEQAGDPFGHLPETLPATIYARKVLKRAQSAGREWRGAGDDPGGRLLAAVHDAVEAGADPELSLRAAADDYRRRAEEEL
jgi:uncharacterized protein YabN with tetrapyrrole methylase and pyrophosphatase domain